MTRTQKPVGRVPSPGESGGTNNGAPPGWENVTLADISESIQYGHTASAVEDGAGIKFLRITDIQNGQVDWSTVPSCEITDDDVPRYRLKPGDIVFARTGATTGKSFLIRKCPEAVFASYLIRVRVSWEVDEAFVALFFQSPDYWRQIEAGKRGVGQPNVNGKVLSQITVPLPPLPEQHRIVAKIEELFSELDKGLENLKQAKVQLAVYRQALLKHAFEGKLTANWRAAQNGKLESGAEVAKRALGGKQAPNNPTDNEHPLGPLPRTWASTRFGAFITSITAGKSFVCEERRPDANEVGVAKVSAVTWGEYDEAESKTCVDQSKVNPASFIQEGDFLLSRANTIELVGTCAIVKRVTQRIMLSDKTLRLKLHGLPQAFFLYYLRSRQGRRQIMSRSTGNQESMRNIGQDSIRQILVPVCSPEEATKLVELLESQFGGLGTQESDIDTNLAKAEALRQSILKKAFSGQLVPQDANDEPASALLARFAAGRKESTRKGTASELTVNVVADRNA